MRDEDRRTKKYKDKLDGSVTGQRFKMLGESMKSQMISQAVRSVDIELKVKQIVKGEPANLAFFYLAYAKEIWRMVERHGRDPLKATLIADKWEARGLKRILMWKIAWEVFGVKIIQTPLKLGARLWLRYEEGSGNIAYDSSGYGHNATLQNVEFSPYGKIGGCAHHSQITAVQVVKHSPDFAPQGGQAVVFWIKVQYEERVAWLAKKTDFTNGWDITLDWVDGLMVITFFVYSNGRADGTFAFIEPDKWNHVVFLWLPDSIKIYVNGTLSTQSGSPGLGFSGTDLLIGEFPSFYGFIDEFMFFNRPLSEDEINQLYNWTGG